MNQIKLLYAFMLAASLGAAQRDNDDTGSVSTPNSNSNSSQILAKSLFKNVMDVNAFVSPEMKKRLQFCISDVNAEWDIAFNFSKNADFLSSCLKQNRDATKRVCNAAEVLLYGSGLIHSTETKGSGGSVVTLNKNCNLSSWPDGCEAGWACSVGLTTKVEFKSKVVPLRVQDCKPCCEGFFCPQGLTCMIPCPLGAYCPVSSLNSQTGVCDPFKYQPPPGQPNHTCGGADIWADFQRGNQLFCSAGSYCPTTTQEIPCTTGHYCRAGSTRETRCYDLAKCDEQAENQNITAYGVIFFAGITLVLMIIYNFSGQVISTREKRQAQSREAAAKSAKENAQAREKWKSAKDVAKKGAIGLQSISRTLSRKKHSADMSKNSGPTKSDSDPKLPPLSGGDTKGKKKRESNLTKIMRDIEENPESEEGFDVSIGENKAKQLHTHSQIFKYAYGQIEKEKALQEHAANLTFSGVISIASDMELSSRPPMEVFFQDLTLTLKGKNKHLLRCVTGKLVPGHVSAVMGPSGAGKTTFLSALTGKAAGCTITGNILINGKNDPMTSYKRIIGYVPQDDVVHGNLTVEENLWFSARCRLPDDLPKPEKVLVVERVIEALGLQLVRDSLVGTVEKRGISGGQRKRVNVGLEMVMEPSLLILDEPTSGLDSSSSLLLLRALRREALEGVNISMVLHQPSYTLYKMFDDIILLAKGGLTVYHGPVKKVEEYFSGLGITVPERMNPPDYFIDILEGITKPSNGMNVKELPLRWMLHNGYPVPTDMLDSTGTTASSSGDPVSASTNSKADTDQSFVVELFQELTFNIREKIDKIVHNFSKSKDLSERKTPGVLLQFKYFLGRLGKQRLREARMQFVDYLILLLAGICLGTLAKVSDETFGSTGYLYTVIAVSLLSKIAALRSFSLDKLHYWRESASGISSLAYFLAKDTIDHFNSIFKPAVYLSMFYFFNNPRSTIYDNYFVLVCLVYCVTGMAYILAIYFEPGPAQLWSVLLPVVLTLVANQDGTSFISKVGDYCYTKWALEAFILANANRYSGVWIIQRCGALRAKHYDLRHYYPNLGCLLAAGIVSRAFGYFILITFQKK